MWKCTPGIEVMGQDIGSLLSDSSGKQISFVLFLQLYQTLNQMDRHSGLGSIPGSGRSPGEGNGSSLQYSCLENPMDRGAWQAAVQGSQE